MPIAERDLVFQTLGFDSKTIILIINAIYQFFHISVEEAADVIVAGKRVDFTSSAHVGQWSPEAV